MELIIGIHTTTIPKISSFFLVDVNYHICECNIYRFLLDYLIASYLSHLSSYNKYKLVSWKLQDTHRDEYKAFPPLEELTIKQGKDARLRAKRPKGQSMEWRKKSWLIAELMEFFKQEVTSDLDSEAQVMGKNTPEHGNGMTKALSPNLAHPRSHWDQF